MVQKDPSILGYSVNSTVYKSDREESDSVVESDGSDRSDSSDMSDNSANKSSI